MGPVRRIACKCNVGEPETADCLVWKNFGQLMRDRVLIKHESYISAENTFSLAYSKLNIYSSLLDFTAVYPETAPL